LTLSLVSHLGTTQKPKNIHPTQAKKKNKTTIVAWEKEMAHRSHQLARQLGHRHLGTAAVLTGAKLSAYERVRSLFSNSPPPLPTLDSRYTMEERLGSGRFGVVHKAICREHGLPVAIKNVSKRAMTSFNSASQEVDILRSLDFAGAKKTSHKRNRREIQTSSATTNQETRQETSYSPSSSILNILETYEDNEDLYIVSDLYTGGELFDRIVNMGDDTFHEKDAAKIMKQLLLAVQYLHEHNISHRDLKPENVVFRSEDSNSDIVLIDFGMAKKFDRTNLFTEQTGTSLYVAPEVLSGKGYDERADIWSGGVLMYIILTGKPPFAGNTPQEIEENVLAGKFNISGGICLGTAFEFLSSLDLNAINKNESELANVAES
jgi:serine/threonine protein kinase